MAWEQSECFSRTRRLSGIIGASKTIQLCRTHISAWCKPCASKHGLKDGAFRRT